MHRWGLAVLLVAAFFASTAWSEDPKDKPKDPDAPPPCAEADLKTLAAQALAAAVTSSGKSTFALDDVSVTSEGGTKVEAVVAALRGAAGKAKLVKHSENLEAPMIHARFSALHVSTAKESTVDYGLYIELEAPNRSLIHANVTTLRKAGPGGRIAGHHTAQTLDTIADHFAVEKWAKDPVTLTITVVGKATSNSIAQQSMVERIIMRLVAAKAPVIAARAGAVDVERPKNARLLGAQVGLLVALSNEADVLFLDGSDLAKGGTVYKYRYPPSAQGAGPGIAVKHMKTLSKSVEFEFRNDNYRVQPAGAKGKVWVLEAKVDGSGGGTLKDQLTVAARSELVGRETPRWLFEAHDGETTVADAKAAHVDILIQPYWKPGKKNKKEVSLELREVATDTVFAEPKATYTEEAAK